MSKELKGLTYSSVSLWQTCQRMFEYRYIDGLVKPKVNCELIVGKSYHEGVGAAIMYKAIHGVPLSLKDTLDAYDTAWNKIKQKETTSKHEDIGVFADIDWNDRAEGTWKDDGAALVKLYYANVLPKISPLEVEANVNTTVEGIYVSGRIDLVLKNLILADHKFASKTMNQQNVDKHLQPGFYAAIKNTPVDFEFHMALNTQYPSTKIIKTRRTWQDIAWVKCMIVGVWKHVKSGIFVPNPTGYACSPRFCGFKDICRSHISTSFVMSSTDKDEMIPW